MLHCHTMLSNATTTIDSVTSYQEYVDMAKSLNMKALAISEHGSVFEHYHKKLAIEKAGMKYIHAIETYVTMSLEEKIRDNYHVLLIAKNYEGFKEINALTSKSFNREDGHFYFSPRITYDELKATSDNVIVSTACLGGILNSAPRDVKNDFFGWICEHKDRCFLEIQPHNVPEQIEYNKKLIELSNKYNVPLLATTDTHSLNDEHSIGRDILQKSKGILFENEEGWDLTFKSYDDLCKAFKMQCIGDDYMTAIENTNKVADMVEEFEITTETKYPKIYDNPEQIFQEKINNGYLNNKYIKNIHSFEDVKKVLHDEFDVYKKTGAIDFMLLQTFLREWEKENGVRCGYSRGSVSGSMIAYLLGITEMDSMRFGLNFFRFMNPDRVSLADIDTDYSEVDRAKVKKFLLADHLGLEQIQTAEIITFNTIATKGAIKDVARAMDIPIDEAQSISNQIINNEVPDELREQYSELFKYVDIVDGTVMSIGSHPSGVLVTDRDISTNIGTCSLTGSEYPVTMLNMKELDALMYVKLDVLGLDGIGVINDACDLIGIDRLNPNNVNLEDEDVWKSIRDDTTLIFQWESNSAHAYLKEFMSDTTIQKVKEQLPNFSYLKWFSFGNGLLRPACASYRDEVAKGIAYDNGLKELNDFLAPTLGRVTMQEDIMKFLSEFCGYTPAEADTVRRGIAKKKGTEQLLPEIEQRFIEYSTNTFGITNEQAQDVIKPFLQVVLDASSYAFSWNHSDSYSAIGYINGYLRYYYPLEFLTAAFNTFWDDQEKTQSITKYANKVSIKVKTPKFGMAQNDYICDKSTNTIYKGLRSIKSFQNIGADILQEISARDPQTFLNVLQLIDEVKIDNKKLNKKSLEILIKIGFFDKFGTIHELLATQHWYDKFGKKKNIKKDGLEDWLCDIVANHCEKETEKTFTKVNGMGVVTEIISKLPKEKEDVLKLIKSQIELLSYTDVEGFDIQPNVYLIQSTHQDKWGRTWATLFQLATGESKEYEVDKTFAKSHKVVVNDVVKCVFGTKPKYTKVDDKWVKTNEVKTFIKFYSIVKE